VDGCLAAVGLSAAYNCWWAATVEPAAVPKAKQVTDNASTIIVMRMSVNLVDVYTKLVDSKFLVTKLKPAGKYRESMRQKIPGSKTAICPLQRSIIEIYSQNILIETV